MSTEHGEKIFFSARGIVNLPLGGQDRQLRFRTHEISMLEDKRNVGIMEMLKSENIGLSFLKDAIAIGVAHEFISSKKQKKSGQTPPRLTEKLVSKWIDNSEDVDGVTFEDLLDTVTKAVVGGMPGGEKYLAAMEDEGDDDDNKDDGKTINMVGGNPVLPPMPEAA